MCQSSSYRTNIIHIFRTDQGRNDLLNDITLKLDIKARYRVIPDILLSFVFLALMIISANSFFYLPFTPVPITTQTFTLMLSVVILKKKWAFLTQLEYVFLGACGLPVFAGGRGGLAVLLGPTGGYILGFIIAAYLTGYLLERRMTLKVFKRFDRSLYLTIVCIAGLGMIYISGYIGLLVNALLLDRGTGIASLSRMVFDLGVRPFIIADMIKIVILVVMTKRLSKGKND